MDKEKHNGYTNYPTWLLASSIDNDAMMYKFYQGYKNAEVSVIISSLEELLKTDIKFVKDINECLLNYAKEQINLPEIAKIIKED